MIYLIWKVMQQIYQVGMIYQTILHDPWQSYVTGQYSHSTCKVNHYKI